MPLWKMFLIALVVGIVGLTLLDLFYWFILYTTVGKYVLAIIYLALFYGGYKVITHDMPKERW